MKLLTGKFIFLFIVAEVFSQTSLREEYQALVEPFVEAVRNNDKEKIASLTRYPLRRQHPIPYIYNEQEMLARYDQIFDEKLIDIIINSSIETDWGDVGWRGIMLNNGVIWIDYDGMVRRINYQSSQENRIRSDIGLVQQPILLNPAGFRLLNKSCKRLHLLLIL